MFARTVSRTFTAGVLSLTLAMTSLTPTTASAQISDEDAIAGILTLLLLGAVIHDRRRSDTPAEPVRPVRPARDWRVLPVECLRVIDTARGNRVRLFAQRCLNNNYDHVNRLPEACHVRVRTESGQRRQGFRARCLRDQGFRTNRR